MTTTNLLGQFPTPKTLLGPGPSDVSDQVLRALAQPVVGHLDPEYLRLMDRLSDQLRRVFRTRNAFTIALPGTGTSGMEACLVNLLEPGETAAVGVAGYFGERMAEVASRCGARVVRVEGEWGRPVPEEAMIDAIRRERPQVVALVHAETSTGVLQPVERIAQEAHSADALMVLDCVTSLGGIPVEIDAWGIDAAYSCSQKCLGCPPGLAPVTVSGRAMAKAGSRRDARRSFYLDFPLLAKYWSEERVYHHTAPVSLYYALHEALSMIDQEGLENRFGRHLRNHRALLAGLSALGLGLASDEAYRLPTLHPVLVPDGAEEAAVRRELLEKRRIEIGSGLGPWKGKVWRIGLMGESSRPEKVMGVLEALEEILDRQGAITSRGGAAAARGFYTNTAESA